MLTLKLTRQPSTLAGTFGRLIGPEGLNLVTGELPWDDNKRQRSCIPLGEYQVVWSFSPKFGYVYRITNVPGRSNILIHPANFCGRASDGLRQELLGCIALGKGLGMYGTQRIITSSRLAVAQLVGRLNRQPFKLEIEQNG